jgi:tRNA threonylcarbamoyl adenosine modification protein YjeE
MPTSHVIESVSEPELLRLGEELAFIARRGDLLALSGELGAGKTTLARAIIRALAGDQNEEIPSPTFTLVQTYSSPRMPVAHFDLYRLGAPEEMEELGLDLALRNGIAIVEWPERAGKLLPDSRLDVRLDDDGAGASRRVTLTGHGEWAQRLDRFMAMRKLIGGGGGANGNGGGTGNRELRYLQGDASVRRYGRLLRHGVPDAILMDWPRQPDGPPIRNGLPYSRLAHLAEDVRPFVAVADALHAAGLTVPRIHAQDLDNGFLLLDDLGDRVFGREMMNGTGQATLWQAAVEALVALSEAPAPEALPVAGGGVHNVSTYDPGAMAIETELIVDWYWPALRGTRVADEERAEFTQLWSQVFGELAKMPAAWVLRDYHSPNLLWLPEREGIARVGVIDFQDAMRGPAAYDLVSLLQDARVDVAPELEAHLFDHYCNGVGARGSFDRDAFAFAYAALGAQRNTKIVGIFARLAKRDGKPQYLQHVPRLWRYLDRDLAHPQLAGLKRWYNRHFPADARAIPAA